MESPFFGSQWSVPSRSSRYPAASQIPVQRQVPQRSPKVVSIPVRFLGPEQTQSASAVTIQKVFRGFLVRKNVKRILEVKREVDEVERKISREEIVDPMRRDPTERLKVSETLMALLFRLDSVPGVDSGVRNCRKAVARRAIGLQEKVDAIVASDQTLGSESRAETPDSDSEVIDGSESKAVDGIQDASVDCNNALDSICQASANGALKTIRDSDDCICSENDIVDGAVQLQNPMESVLDSGDTKVVPESEPDCGINSVSEIKDEMDLTGPAADCEINANEEAAVAEEIIKYATDTEVARDSAPDCCLDEINKAMDVTELAVDSDEVSAPKEITEDPNSTLESNKYIEKSSKIENLVQGGEDTTGNTPRHHDRSKENKPNGELLEKIVEDNEKLMGLMTKLFERNEAQTRLLGSLSERVENLERALACERLRKKKKRPAAGQDPSPDPKKCGKKL